MNMLGFILIIALIVVGVAIYNDGWEKFQENPLDSIINGGKKIIDTGKDITSNLNNETELIEVGKLPCANNEDCNLLEACENNCTCFDNGVCYQGG